MALLIRSTFWLISSILIARVFAQTDTSTCTEGCSEFDIQYSNEYYFNGGANATDTSTYPALLNAVCTLGGTIPPILADLQNCVSCNKDGLGTNSLLFYQAWTVDCGVYLGTGFQSALSILSSWDDAMYTSFFSASVLPVVATASTVYPITLDAAATPTASDSSATSSASVASSAIAVASTSTALATSSTSAAAVLSGSASSVITSATVPGTSSIPALLTGSSTASATVTPVIFPTTTTGVTPAASTSPAAASPSAGASALKLEQFSVFTGLLVLVFNCLNVKFGGS